MNRPQIAALAAVSLLCSACEKAEIAVYRVPKEAPRQVAAATANPAPAPATAPAAAKGPASAAPAPMANTAVPTATGGSLAWSAPEHWKAQPANPMRRGSYLVTDERNNEADMSVTAFPSDVGGELANVNRWRAQVGLEPIAAAQLTAALARQEKNGLKMAVFEAAGTGPGAKRILGAMVPYDGGTWFFKLIGQDALVAKEKPAFLALLATVKPAAK